jgi:metal-dependent amidase/aminoacylase/carboxypeptidase family protein
MTILVTEVIHRPIERMVLRLPFMTEVVILVLISVLFVYDVIQSTKAAFNMARALERMAKLREELDDLQVQMALLRAETAQNLAERKDEMALGLMARREAVAEGIQNRYDAVAEGIQTRYDAVAEGIQTRYDAVTEGIQNRYDAVADKLQAGRVAVAEGIQSRKDAVSNKLEAVADGLQERREARVEAEQERRAEELQIFKDAQAEQLRLLNAEYTKKAAQFQQIVLPMHLDILRRNPSASSRRFRKVFGELRERITRKSA